MSLTQIGFAIVDWERAHGAHAVPVCQGGCTMFTVFLHMGRKRSEDIPIFWSGSSKDAGQVLCDSDSYFNRGFSFDYDEFWRKMDAQMKRLLQRSPWYSKFLTPRF